MGNRPWEKILEEEEGAREQLLKVKNRDKKGTLKRGKFKVYPCSICGKEWKMKKRRKSPKYFVCPDCSGRKLREGEMAI